MIYKNNVKSQIAKGFYAVLQLDFKQLLGVQIKALRHLVKAHIMKRSHLRNRIFHKGRMVNTTSFWMWRKIRRISLG